MLVFQKMPQRFFEIIWNKQMEPSCIYPLLVLINLLIIDLKKNKKRANCSEAYYKRGL